MKRILLWLPMLFFMSCSKPASYVLEITTFKTKPATNASAFHKLDGEVEARFTSKQPGFMKRQSAVTEEGEYVVLVYWNSMEEAEASMNKFMSDESVAGYASMIDGATMSMSRYRVREKFDAEKSSFIEVMSFETKAAIEQSAFRKINKKVGQQVTAPKEGFAQRITGVNDTGRQVVVVYWDNKTNSDAALQPFMEHELSKKFMEMMDQSSIRFGRYETLN